MQLKSILITGLVCLYVSAYAQEKKSLEVPGTIINHVSAAQNLYIGSPSICILPNGDYIATHEFFGSGIKGESSVVKVFKSEDKGETWDLISEIVGQVWSKVFVLKDDLYILGPVENGGDLVIRKSSDGGVTWTSPVDRYTGRLFQGRYHAAPTPVLIYKKRIWKGVEDLNGPKGKWGKNFRALVISAPIESDLLDYSSWTKSNPLQYNESYLNGDFGGWLEGNVVAGPDGQIYNILRTDYRKDGVEKASMITVSDDGKEAQFDPDRGFINFPGACKKLHILYDSISNKYWCLSNHVPESQKGYNPERTRNTLSLLVSDDLIEWSVKGVVLHHPDIEKHGFQYADFQFEGDDIIFVSRTAYDDKDGGADNQHNANYLTFHRVENFRSYETPKQWRKLMK